MTMHYRDITGLNDEGYDDYDKEFVIAIGIPVDGVQELCLLHDVVEDTEYLEEDIEDVYESAGLGRFYKLYIKEPLKLITHDKSEPYEIYIQKVIKHPTSALVKFLDLIDNSYPLTLDRLGDKEVDRLQRYASYMKTINDKYSFIFSLNMLDAYIKEKRMHKETDC